MGKGWTMPVQRASFGGVRFDVVSIDDVLDRAIVEHAYPFVNGADIEDFGLNPLNVQLQAVFFGEGYYADFKRFLSLLQKQGAAVLVHPVRGRLPNMICTSARFRHEAEFVDYVTVDLCFKEATPAKPIFLFESSLLSKVDALLSQLESLVDDAMGLFAVFMSGVAVAQNFKSRLLGCWGALVGMVEQVLKLFDLDVKKYSLLPNVSSANFQARATSAMKMLAEMTALGLKAVAAQPSLSLKSRFDEVLRSVQQLQAVGGNLVSGKETLLTETKLNALAKGTMTSAELQQSRARSLVSAVSESDVQYADCVLRLCAVVNLAQMSAEWLQDDEILPHEIEYITTKVRSEFQGVLRQLAQMIDAENTQDLTTRNAPTTGVYGAVVQLSEDLRTQAHQFTQLALCAINRKPPLKIREMPFDGHIVQVAHAFYEDATRADELLRLNPQVRYPNLIEKGALLNSYAE